MTFETRPNVLVIGVIAKTLAHGTKYKIKLAYLSRVVMIKFKYYLIISLLTKTKIWINKGFGRSRLHPARRSCSNERERKEVAGRKTNAL